MACNSPIPSHFHPSPTNERHLSLNNQAMINIQNANNQLSQPQHLNAEYHIVSYSSIIKMQKFQSAKAQLSQFQNLISYCPRKEMWRYNILLDCICIKSTDGSFGTHEKVVIPIPIAHVYSSHFSVVRENFFRKPKGVKCFDSHWTLLCMHYYGVHCSECSCGGCVQWYRTNWLHIELGNDPVAWVWRVLLWRRRILSVAHNGTCRLRKIISAIRYKHISKLGLSLWELEYRMGSHSVTCHPAETTFPPLPQPKLVLNLATPSCKTQLDLCYMKVDGPKIVPVTNNLQVRYSTTQHQYNASILP